MAIAHRANGFFVAGINSLSPQIPGGTVSGDMMLCFVFGKPHNASYTLPAGWNALTRYTDGTTAAGNDSGSMSVQVFWKENAGESGTVAVTEGATGFNVYMAFIVSYQKGGSETWDTPVSMGGGDNTSGTGFSVSLGSVALNSGDHLIGVAAFPSDAITPLSAHLSTNTVAHTLTGHTHVPAADEETTTGGDMGMCGFRSTVSTGGTGSLSVSGTLAAAGTGALSVIRLRVTAGGPTTHQMALDLTADVAIDSALTQTHTGLALDLTANTQIDTALTRTATGFALDLTADVGIDTAALVRKVLLEMELTPNVQIDTAEPLRTAGLALDLSPNVQIDTESPQRTATFALDLTAATAIDSVFQRIATLASDLGIDVSTATEMFRTAALALDLTPDVAIDTASPQRTATLGSELTADVTIDSDLTHIPDGATTHALDASLDIAFLIDTEMTRIATLAADLGAQLAADSDLTRTATLGASLDAQAGIDSDLTRTATMALELAGLVDFASALTATHMLSLDQQLVATISTVLQVDADEAAQIVRHIQMSKFGIY